MGGLTFARRNAPGFTLIEIMIVVLITGILLGLAVPSWIGARSRSNARSCVAQMRQVRYAKECWAMDNRKDTGDTPAWDDLSPTYLKERPECPAGGDYTIGNVSVNPTCSIGGTHVLD